MSRGQKILELALSCNDETKSNFVLKEKEENHVEKANLVLQKVEENHVGSSQPLFADTDNFEDTTDEVLMQGIEETLTLPINPDQSQAEEFNKTPDEIESGTAGEDIEEHKTDPPQKSDIEGNDSDMDWEPTGIDVREEIETESISENDVNTSTRENGLQTIHVQKRSLNAKDKEKNWDQLRNKKKREKGIEYKGKKKDSSGKWSYDVERTARFIRDPCNCKLSNAKSKLKCKSLSTEIRQQMFDKFWTTMSWDEKKMYVRGLVRVNTVHRRRGCHEKSRRNYSMSYFLKHGIQLVKVCKKMFAGTLGMKERNVINWVKEDIEEEKVDNIGEPICNRKSEARNKKFIKEVKELEEFFNVLPKMESHYCRASTNRLYLEPIWRSKSHLYQFYKNQHCLEKGVEPVSDAKFYTTMQELKISVFRPKKGECDICVGYRTHNIDEEKYLEHQILKEEARSEKEKDKLAADSLTFTLDLQSVSLSPKTNVSAMYYKTKLIVHNFTIYDLQTKEGYCLLWNESEGQTTEFTSLLIYFLEEKVIPNAKQSGKKMILYSDGCTGQNRNSILSNALFHFASINDVTIIQKYLQKGHTQMEVDSMHSSIERILRRTKISLPADYIEVCRDARRLPFPYKVEYFTHEFFRNFSSLQYFNSIRPGRAVGSPTVMDLKALKYENATLTFKLRHSFNSWNELPRRINNTLKHDLKSYKNLPAMYLSRRKIKKEKYDHLQLLMKSLEKEYQDFYINLPHE